MCIFMDVRADTNVYCSTHNNKVQDGFECAAIGVVVVAVVVVVVVVVLQL